MGRPRKVIDEVLVADLARIMCTMVEIAACCRCSVDTLERRFADVIKTGQEEGKTSIRRQQYKLMMDGNAALAIWLGKQYLGQTEKVEQTGDVQVKVEWEEDVPGATYRDDQIAATA